MAYAGYAAAITLMGETSTTMTAEAMTGSGAGPYTISSSTKQVWDPNNTITFYDNGVAISASDISSIDFLLGKVTFTSSKTGPITVTGKYFLTFSITDASDVDFELSREMLDTTVFDSTGAKTVTPGLQTASGTIHLKNRLDIDYVTGSGTRKLLDCLTGGTPFVLSIRPRGTGQAPKYRLWAIITKGAHKLSVNGLLEGDVDFELYQFRSTGGFPVGLSVTDT